jgi:hypothetical protein
MSNTEIIELVGGVIAVVLGGIDVFRSQGQSLAAWGVAVLGVVFVLLALT